MKRKKRPRPYDGPPPWNPYLIQKMTPEEAAPLLWVPQILETVPYTPTQPYQYGIPVVVDEETEERLDTKYTWLTLSWLIGYKKDIGLMTWSSDHSKWIPSSTAELKINLFGTDDSNYGAWLTPRGGTAFIDTWDKLQIFLEECGARELGINGEYLLGYCDASLGAFQRDYN